MEFDLKEFIRQTVREEVQNMLGLSGTTTSKKTRAKRGTAVKKEAATTVKLTEQTKGAVAGWLKKATGMKGWKDIRAIYGNGAVFKKDGQLPPKKSGTAAA